MMPPRICPLCEQPYWPSTADPWWSLAQHVLGDDAASILRREDRWALRCLCGWETEYCARLDQAIGLFAQHLEAQGDAVAAHLQWHVIVNFQAKKA